MDSLRNTKETVLTLQSLTRRREMRLMTPLKENYYCSIYFMLTRKCVPFNFYEAG